MSAAKLIRGGLLENSIMKKPSINLLRYWSRCQKGAPVSFDSASYGKLSLRLGCSSEASDTGPMLYARINIPTGRLLVHFLWTDALKDLALLQNGMLRIPDGSTLGPRLAHLLSLPEERHQLRPGEYPLLTDERFLTASIELVRTRQPVIQLSINEPSFTACSS